jgi:hypothetical protein
VFTSSWIVNEAAAAGRIINGFTLSISNSQHRCVPMMNGRTAQFHVGTGWLTQLDLLHSVAHVITPDTVAFHGPQWAKNYLKVVQTFASTRKRNELRDAFKEFKVQYIYKSDEAKEAARQRAAEHGTPFTRPKVSREAQQDDLVAMMRELAGLPPEPEPEDPIDRMLKAARRAQP